MLYGWMIVWALGGVGSPAVNAILSRQVPPDEQGELQGALGSLSSLTSIFAPEVMTNLFSFFTSGHAAGLFPGRLVLRGRVVRVRGAFHLLRGAGTAARRTCGGNDPGKPCLTKPCLAQVTMAGGRTACAGVRKCLASSDTAMVSKGSDGLVI